MAQSVFTGWMTSIRLSQRPGSRHMALGNRPNPDADARSRGEEHSDDTVRARLLTISAS